MGKEKKQKLEKNEAPLDADLERLIQKFHQLRHDDVLGRRVLLFLIRKKRPNFKG